MNVRKFKKLRISLIDTCNMACTYCVPENHVDGVRAQLSPTLSVVELIDIIRELHENLDLEKIRITGGEPLMYPHVVYLIQEIKQLGIHDIALTSNAYYLKQLAGRLKQAGLQSVNISLDAVDAEIFEKMTRKKMLQKTLDGIQAALDHGLKVKLNSVILKGANDKQILPLLAFGSKMNIPIRFLELMKMGYLHHSYQQYFFSQNEILNEIGKVYKTHKKKRKANATANYWKLDGLDYEFGIIANESEPFCKDCDRLRLDSYGKLFGCISANKGIAILKKIKQHESIEEELALAMKQKQPIHFTGSEMSMRHIGG